MFQTTAIEKEAKDFSQLELHPKHRGMVEQVARVVEKYVDIDHLALMGFAWKSIKDWQIQHQMTALEVSMRSKQERDQATKEMLEICKGYLVRILQNPEDINILEKAMEDAYNYYLEFISK